MRLRWLTIPVLIAALALLSACGSDDDDSPADSSDFTPGAGGTEAATSSGDGGGSANNDGDTVDLGDTPVALPDWADAVATSESGPLDIVQFIVPLDQQDATIAFFEDWTENQPEDYIRSDSASGGVTFQSDVAVGEDKTIISILAPLDGDDFVTVTVSHGPFE